MFRQEDKSTANTAVPKTPVAVQRTASPELPLMEGMSLDSLSPENVMQLQSLWGNEAVAQLLSDSSHTDISSRESKINISPSFVLPPVQRKLQIGGSYNAEEGVINLVNEGNIDDWDEDAYDLKGEAWNDVVGILKQWVQLDETKRFDNDASAVAAAVAVIKAYGESSFDNTQFTGVGFTVVETMGLFDYFNDDNMDIIIQQGAVTGLKDLYDESGFGGIDILFSHIPNEYCFTDVLSTYDGNFNTILGDLSISKFAELLQGKTTAKFALLDANLTLAHVNALTVTVNHLLMEENALLLASINANWGAISPYLNNTITTNHVLGLLHAPNAYPVANVATLLGYIGMRLSLDDLTYMKVRMNNPATLIAYLQEGSVQYGESAAELRQILNAHANALPAVLTAALLAHVSVKSPLSGSEIEKLHTNGNAVITYSDTFQTVKEQQDGGGTHNFTITILGVATNHQIHVHYNPGQNKRTEYATSHIKPSAFSDIRHPVSHALTIALIALVP